MDKPFAELRPVEDTERVIGTSRIARTRIVSLVMAAGLALSLCACGFISRDSDGEGTAPVAGQAPTTTTAAAAAQSGIVETSAPSQTDTGTVSRPSVTADTTPTSTPASTTTSTTTSPSASTGTSVVVSNKTNSVDIVVADMKLNNDLRLAGIPLERGWSTGPGFVTMGNDPRGTRTPVWWNPGNQYYKSGAWWTHIVPWMVVFDGVGNAATNTRVELRPLKAYYKSRSTGQWILLAQGQIEGQNFPKYLNAVSAGNPDLVPIGGGSVSVLPPSTDLHFHGWCCGRALPNPADIAAIHITTQARLTVNNPNLPDDRAAARYLVQVGGDYYPDASLNVNLFAPDNWNPGIGCSRSKLITNSWQSFSFTTIDVGVQTPGGASISEAEFRANPPPLD